MTEKFDSDFYGAIWGTVHRHDYTKDLASSLISQYGKVKFLDVGSGCGALVAELRRKGADAWGLEISGYAVANTCAPGYMLKGSVTDIPWKDKAFDVVHSLGLWEYLTEEEIPQAVKEVHRVGRLQEHAVDHDKTTCDPAFKYVTWKPQEWWAEKLKPPKILVGCPQHECKEYAFQRWIDNVKALTYPNYDVMVVDNSPTLDFYNRWKYDVLMSHIDVNDGPEKRINWSMEELRKHFIEGDYVNWLNIESDVIPPHDVIEQMLAWDQGTDWLTHAYPMRGSTKEAEQGIGCSLFSRRLMEAFCFYNAGGNYSADGWLWAQVKEDRRFRVMEVWHYMKVDHLGS